MPNPILITGGKAEDAIKRATAYLNMSEAVVIFHPFPEDTAQAAPPRAELVFDLNEDSLSTADVAAIYRAKKVVNLDKLN